MQRLDFGTEDQWSLSWLFGFEHPLFKINTEIVIHTWIILGLLALICIGARALLKKKESTGQFIVISLISFLVNLCNQALGTFSFLHFSFIATLFVFIFACNTISIIPWMGEPTRDLNTTLALGLISFVYTQCAAIKNQGLWNYCKTYFSPIFFMFPLNLIGKLSSIVSISFRLFGNIFGGSIISGIYFSAIKGSLLLETAGMVLGLNLLIVLFFSLFEGFLQAFVFSMLSLTYLSIAIHTEGDH